MDTLESLRTKLESASDIDRVVKTMKAVAAANIGQYEQSVSALEEYNHTVSLGLTAYFRSAGNSLKHNSPKIQPGKNELIAVIVFGSDQGLVGRFNDSLTNFVSASLSPIPNNKEIWSVGERVQLLLKDGGLNATRLFDVPGEVKAVTKLVADLLTKAQQSMDEQGIEILYTFHNQPVAGLGYTPVMQRLLPLDEAWMNQFANTKWPTNNLPQVAGNLPATISALIKEYLFVSLFKACAESLASENSSRLSAMQRAEKNIDELMKDLDDTFHRLRQSSIDEELFDVIAGFEALKNNPGKI